MFLHPALRFLVYEYASTRLPAVIGKRTGEFIINNGPLIEDAANWDGVVSPSPPPFSPPFRSPGNYTLKKKINKNKRDKARKKKNARSGKPAMRRRGTTVAKKGEELKTHKTRGAALPLVTWRPIVREPHSILFPFDRHCVSDRIYECTFMIGGVFDINVRTFGAGTLSRRKVATVQNMGGSSIFVGRYSRGHSSEQHDCIWFVQWVPNPDKYKVGLFDVESNRWACPFVRVEIGGHDVMGVDPRTQSLLLAGTHGFFVLDYSEGVLRTHEWNGKYRRGNGTSFFLDDGSIVHVVFAVSASVPFTSLYRAPGSTRVFEHIEDGWQLPDTDKKQFGKTSQMLTRRHHVRYDPNSQCLFVLGLSEVWACQISSKSFFYSGTKSCVRVKWHKVVEPISFLSYHAKKRLRRRRRKSTALEEYLVRCEVLRDAHWI